MLFISRSSAIRHANKSGKAYSLKLICCRLGIDYVQGYMVVYHD